MHPVCHCSPVCIQLEPEGTEVVDLERLMKVMRDLELRGNLKLPKPKTIEQLHALLNEYDAKGDGVTKMQKREWHRHVESRRPGCAAARYPGRLGLTRPAPGCATHSRNEPSSRAALRPHREATCCPVTVADFSASGLASTQVASLPEG